MAAMLRILEVLTAAQIEQLENFCRERARTVDDIHGFVADLIQSTGEKISRNAAWNWKTGFEARLMEERFSRSSELATAIKGAVNKGSFGDVADAAVMQLTQVVFEQASQLEAGGEIDPLDVQRMTRSLRNLVGSKSELEQYKTLATTALKTGEQMARTGASGEAVVNKVREILGIKEAA